MYDRNYAVPDSQGEEDDIGLSPNPNHQEHEAGPGSIPLHTDDSDATPSTTSILPPPPGHSVVIPPRGPSRYPGFLLQASTAVSAIRPDYDSGARAGPATSSTPRPPSSVNTRRVLSRPLQSVAPPPSTLEPSLSTDSLRRHGRFRIPKARDYEKPFRLGEIRPIPCDACLKSLRQPNGPEFRCIDMRHVKNGTVNRSCFPCAKKHLQYCTPVRSDQRAEAQALFDMYDRDGPTLEVRDAATRIAASSAPDQQESTRSSPQPPTIGLPPPPSVVVPPPPRGLTTANANPGMPHQQAAATVKRNTQTAWVVFGELVSNMTLDETLRTRLAREIFEYINGR